MDEKSLELLEFPKVRALLAAFTSFAASHELAIDLRPLSEVDGVSQLLRQSAEARRLLSLEPGFSIGGVRDIRDAATMAAVGTVLEPATIADVHGTLGGARVLRSSIEKLAGDIPSLWSIAGQILSLPQLEHEIGRCINTSGELLDAASARLASLRQQIRECRGQLLARLEGVIKSPKGRRLVQEPLITERAGRHVIPVRAELQAEMKGIVHDVSNTGATVFIEPWAAVELGNKLRQLAVEEEQEAERILRALSAEIGAKRDIILGNLALVAQVDLALAKARYAERTAASEPVVFDFAASTENGAGGQIPVLRLVNARHPLLKGTAVPLSIEIGGGFSGLIITGPNTGGKTVALKTIGLLSVMAQAGIPIPASPSSRLPIFDGIFADIGDEQSIEHTLSTFSWHVGNIVRIVRESTSRSLVLLDELGASTDPAEGAALARAILLHFLAKSTYVVATTHFGELKVFAHTTPGLRNASLDFDPATLAPTYHLTVGIPGGSNALSIAAQLGLPSDIVDRARGMLAPGTLHVEELLSDLAKEKQLCAALSIQMENEREEAARLRGQWERRLQELREEERNTLLQARDRVVQEAASLQKQIRQAATDLRKAKSSEAVERAQQALKTVRKEIGGPSWQPRTAGPEAGSNVPGPDAVAVGDLVRVANTNIRGTVLALFDRDSQIEIQAGRTKIRLSLTDVERLGSSPEKASIGPPMVGRNLSGRSRSLELDLRGRRAEEIEPELDTYLNDVSLAGFAQVRIIHGFGTGTVRQIVRNMLASHPLVRSFRAGGANQGGDGVTVVEL